MSRLERGAKNDISNYDNEPNQTHTYLDLDEWVGADAIYESLRGKYGANIISCFPRHEETNPSKKQWNNYFARYCSMIENVNRFFKRWAICKAIFRGSLTKLERYWNCVGILTQLRFNETGGPRGHPERWLTQKELENRPYTVRRSPQNK